MSDDHTPGRSNTPPPGQRPSSGTEGDALLECTPRHRLRKSASGAILTGTEEFGSPASGWPEGAPVESGEKAKQWDDAWFFDLFTPNKVSIEDVPRARVFSFH